MQILLGFIFGALIGLVAWRAHALTTSGVVAATLVGGLIFGLGGLPWAVLLMTFFISSSALSRAFARRKAALNEKFSKGSRRDWGQVLANGGAGALLALIYGLRPEPWVWAAFAGAMAAVNADTWATEIGVLSRSAPRLIVNGKIVERGTSGGITALGTFAALGGAALIGAFVGAFSAPGDFLALWGITSLAGLVGSLFDSLLGATVQAIYSCPSCQKETERHPLHTCGTATTLVRGWRWMNNDVVNFLCSVAGALVAAGLWALR
jgi:uncharacterized protein (TIGR00297 family)